MSFHGKATCGSFKDHEGKEYEICGKCRPGLLMSSDGRCFGTDDDVHDVTNSTDECAQAGDNCTTCLIEYRT